jgi:hypothetical protein
MSDASAGPTPSLSELPHDELLGYGRDLGLDLTSDQPQGEVLRLVRQRQELLLELDREAMLEVVVWARRPVRRSASKEVLARQIAQVPVTGLESLSSRGLDALARLRGVAPEKGETRARLERRLRKTEGWRARLRRARRALAGRVIAQAVEQDSKAEYRFLPEDEGLTLRQQIETEGVVGGIARKLRGYADDYVREKLDDIELRIDHKLDEIDQRLGEWRDREVGNRLRILKLTLIFSILVALISLGYDCVSTRLGPAPAPDSEVPASETSASVPDEQPSRFV